MADDLHDDDRDDPRRLRAIEVAKRALDGAPVHPDHRHGVIVGIALDPTDRGEYVAVIAIVQGVDVPCWVALDDDDLDRLRQYLDLRDRPARVPVH